MDRESKPHVLLAHQLVVAEVVLPETPVRDRSRAGRSRVGEDLGAQLEHHLAGIGVVGTMKGADHADQLLQLDVRREPSEHHSDHFIPVRTGLVI
jgi:hypothetical protein